MPKETTKRTTRSQSDKVTFSVEEASAIVDNLEQLYLRNRNPQLNPLILQVKSQVQERLAKLSPGSQKTP